MHLNNAYSEFNKKLSFSKKNDDLLDLGEFLNTGSTQKKPEVKKNQTGGSLFNPDDIMLSFNGHANN